MQTLETQRLFLSPFVESDENILHQLFIDPFIRKYLWDDESLSPEESLEVLNKNIDHFEKDYWGLWKIQEKEAETVMGFTGLWYFFEEPQPQLLYGILEKYSGKGFASEAARKILAYAFEELNFDYLLAAMDEGHLASERLAQRIGMSFHEKKVADGKATLFYKIEKTL